MIAFSLRQFRAQALCGLGAVVVVAIVLAITGPHLFSVYDSGVAACRASGGVGPDCANLLANSDAPIQAALLAVVLIAPALIGMFWGAPLIGRELETGTFRLAWTQSVDRTRWLVTKLTLVGTASALGGAGLGLMASWWSAPFDKVNQNLFAPGLFAMHGFVPGGYALFAFALGATTGVLFRRTFPAMAATLVGFIVVRVLVTFDVRPYLLPASTKTLALSVAGSGFELSPSGGFAVVPNPPQLPNAWVLSTSLVNAHGQAPTQSFIDRACSGMPGVNGTPLPNPSGVASHVPSPALQHIAQHCVATVAASYHVLVRYQPADHYWPMQCLETLLFVLAALALGGLSYFWVRRRIA